MRNIESRRTLLTAVAAMLALTTPALARTATATTSPGPAPATAVSGATASTSNDGVRRLAYQATTPRAAAPAASAPRTSATANWTMFRGNARHTAFNPVNVNLPLEVAWTYKGDATAVVASPVIVDGTVYVGTRDDSNGNKGSLLAIDMETGKLKWRYNVSDKSRTIMTHSAKVQTRVGADSNPEAVSWVDSTPSVVGNTVYVMSRDGALHAITTDGKLKWRLRTGGLDMSSPVVASGTVFVGSGYPNKDFWAVDAASGVVKWRTNSGLPDPQYKRPGQFVYSSPAFADGVMYGAANDGGFYAMDARTGAVKWRYETQGGVYFHSPTVAGDFVIGVPGDYDTAVYAIKRSTGELAWKYNSGLEHSYVSSPAYDGETVYVGMGEPMQQIVALNAKSGAEKWKYVTGYATQNNYTSSPAVTNNVVLVGTAQAKRSDPESGRLVALDKAKGAVLWETKLPKPVLSSPAVAGNYVVVGCMDGTVRAFKWAQ